VFKKEVATYSKENQIGIQLHHQIDQFTDSHPLNKNLQHLLNPHFHKYSGVFIDLIYDHLLSIHWNTFYSSSLQEVVDAFIHAMNQQEHLPLKIREIWPYVLKYKWLSQYKSVDTMKNVFMGMDRRSGFKSNLSKGYSVFEDNENEIKNTFFAFYPEILQYTQDYLKTNEVTEIHL
jgi:acyl carrier protein phosphodiesterase